MHSFPKRKLVVGLTVLAVAALAGGAFAATQGSSNPRQAYLNDVAKRLNVTPAQLQSALKGAAIDQLDAAVKAGKLTQAQANALKQGIQQGAPGGAPFLGPPPGFGPGPFGPRGEVFFGPVAAAAKYLGLSRAQLRDQLASGKSLAQIAKAQGKTASGLEQAMTASVKARLDKAVANKRITAAQEQRMLKGLTAGIDDMVNNTPPEGAPGFGPDLHRAFFIGPGAPLKVAAKYLGLTPAQLRTQLASGKSLAQIAKAQGKTTAGIEQALTAAAKTRLDKAVAKQRLTAAQEQKILKAMSALIDNVVNHTLPEGGPRFAPPGFGYHKAFRGGFARPGALVPVPPAPAGPVA